MDDKLETLTGVLDVILAEKVESDKALAVVEEYLDRQIANRKQIEENIKAAKALMKEVLPDGTITRKLLDKTLKGRVSTRRTVVVDDLSQVPEDYITEEEIDNIIERDGKYYQKSCDTKKVKNLVTIGAKCPDGCHIKETKIASIIYNGEYL